MLQRIGDALKGSKHHRWLAYFVVVALSLVFVAWGAFGIVNLSVGESNYAADANGTKISLEEARNAWLRQQAMLQQRLRGAELPPQLRESMQNDTLENLIKGALMAQRTDKLGYRVGADELRQAIQEEPAFQISGSYSADVARAALAQAGIPYATFENQLRTELRRAHLEGGIRISNFLTPAELARLAMLEDQQREVRYFVLPADRFAAAVKVDDAAIAAYYKVHQAQFMTPESDRIEYAQLRLDTLVAQQTISDADLHEAYDKAKSHLMLPEKRHAHHILITGKDDAAALAQAQQVLAELKAGKDFGALAKQYSQDQGSAQNGGDLGWAERTSFVAPFADALFGMQVGEIKGPVKTEYGYHIIRLDEVQAAKGKSFEEARADLETQLRRDRATDRFGEIQEQLQGKLAEPGADLGALAQEYQLEHGDIAHFLKGPGGAPLGVAEPLQDLLFTEPALATGRIAGPVLAGEDRLVVAKVLEHQAPQPQPLAEVRDSIIAAITKQQAAQAVLQAAQAARARLEAGANFDTLVQDLKVTAEPAHFIGRNDPSVQAEVRAAAFAVAVPAGKPAFSDLTLSSGGAAVLEVSAVRTAPAAAATVNLQRGLREAETQGSSDATAYVAEVRRTADVKKNPKAFE